MSSIPAMDHHPNTPVESYLMAFHSWELDGFARDPSWLRSLRQAAIARFQELGFPTARRGNEEWKYTDVRPIARTLFRSAPSAPQPPTLPAEELAPFMTRDPGESRLVFIDGGYVEQLSSIASLPAGASVISLAAAFSAKADLMEQHLARHAPYESNAFTALNTAFLQEGALVHIPDGVAAPGPIHLVFLFTQAARESVFYPRVLIVAGKQSQATVVESYGGLTNAPYFTNAVTELVLGPGAVVDYYKLQRESEEAYHITTTQVDVGRDANFSSMNLDLGGVLTRNNLHALMGDEGGSCRLNGLYLIGEAQHVDNEVIIDHAKPFTTSRELYKGVLNGRARSVFHGSIIVRPGAKKVNALQEDKNLLLSDQAEADTKPAFWIYCDDVKCGHGAACGQLDEQALFYLRSRGLSEEAARQFLVRGFVNPVIEGIGNEALRSRVNDLVQTRLQGWLGGEPSAIP